MMRKVIYIITIINLIFQGIYMTVGKYTMSEMTNIKYIFYIFRPEYMLISGIIAIIILIVTFILIIKSIKKVYIFDIIALLLNFEYIIYYFNLLKYQ